VQCAKTRSILKRGINYPPVERAGRGSIVTQSVRDNYVPVRGPVPVSHDALLYLAGAKVRLTDASEFTLPTKMRTSPRPVEYPSARS